MRNKQKSSSNGESRSHGLFCPFLPCPFTMKLSASFLFIASLQLAAHAHADKNSYARHVKRQEASSSTQVAPTTPATTGTPISATNASGTSIPATGAAGPSTTAQATYTTIPPIESITFGMPTRATTAFVGTRTPGEKPPISGAPVLPPTLQQGIWPEPDKVPPTDSPQVKEWMKELEGHNIPNFAPTKQSSCAGDPEAAAQAAERGWWTCGGHTRSTDIVSCPTKLDWGISFDDGPSPQTPNLLTKLKEEKLHATFFVVGSRVVQNPAMVVEEYMSGHELSVHTWSHTTLTTLTNEQIVAELGWTRKAIKDAIGVTPTTMRPPQGDIDDRVRAISLAMGLVPILWTMNSDGAKFDSNDWRVAGGLATGSEALAAFKGMLDNGTTIGTGFISLQHDLFEITVDLAVGYFLDLALAHNPKYKLQSIGECLAYPAGNLYRETSSNKTFPFTNLDVDGDGVIDVPKAGNNKNTGTSGAVGDHAPFWASVVLAGGALLAQL